MVERRPSQGESEGQEFKLLEPEPQVGGSFRSVSAADLEHGKCSINAQVNGCRLHKARGFAPLSLSFLICNNASLSQMFWEFNKIMQA